jgi:flagellar protein FlaG
MSEISTITLAASAKIQATSVLSNYVTEIKQPIPAVDLKTVDASALKFEDTTKLNLDTAKAVATKGNEILQYSNHSLSFQIDDTTKHVIIKIVDTESGELIRQIPTAEMLDFMKRMKEWEGNSGSLLQTKA